MAILTYIFMMERSSPQIPPGLSSSPSRPTLSGDSPKSRDELKHVQDNVELMRNRVQLLKFQLQREKDTISKHKSLTREVVQQKIEYNKLYSIVVMCLCRKRKITMPSTTRSPPSARGTTPTARCTSRK
jgi:hypothetical protein